YVLSLCLVLGAALSAAAETKSGNPAGSTAPGQEQTIKIKNAAGALRHGGAVEVTLEGYEDYLKNNNNLSKYSLYLDGIKVIQGARQIGKGILVFDFRKAKMAEGTWGKLSRCITSKATYFTPTFMVSLQYDKNPIITSDDKYALTYITHKWFWPSLGVYVALLLMFGYFAKTTGLIRDSRVDIKTVKKRPYSLGKSQLAFWFLIALPCFFFIWLVTGSTESLTSSTLILLGISSLTTLTAGYVEKDKTAKENEERPKLIKKKGDLESEQDMVLKEIKVASRYEKARLNRKEESLKDQVEQIDSQLESMALKKTPPRPFFFRDVISDNSGVNLPRLQCAIWTLVLGFIFISTTFCSLAMPEFSATLLALMGISNGTYVAMKLPEK
ncbi:MAG: hypothetical protein KQI62_20085, partial [Deltaproteobacteria bacterium]|nr:hypothetical protein [Deltaproteobacteria bacterium]